MPHSPSSLECEEGKVYNEKIQFAQMIIHDTYRFGTSVIEFCIYVEEVGIQVSKQDHELHQWIW
jgi:hypothetical protein